MNPKDPTNNESYRHPNENTLKQQLGHETNKKGQRHGGIDKNGNKIKDKKGEF